MAPTWSPERRKDVRDEILLARSSRGRFNSGVAAMSRAYLSAKQGLPGSIPGLALV